MSNNLVIVESPAKVKTIKKYLGSSYEVMASNGHVRDLPKSTMGVDVENNYEPKYITIRGKGDLLSKLRKQVKKSDKIYLATDPDREGEAISWHLTKALKLDDTDKKVYRISFNEITKPAIKEAIKNPRKLDMNLVDAQQARRVLDRVVGYRISPLLWSKIKRGLSAGRVQSVALHMIAERDAAIDAFIPSEYWSIDADLALKNSKNKYLAKFQGKYNKDSIEKITIASEKEAKKIEKELSKASFEVLQITKSKRTRKAPLPFTTSTLQQEASKVLNFSTQKTMKLAQQLYEGIDIKSKGTMALITYLRTDSTRVSDEADKAAREFIKSNYSEKYVAQALAKSSTGTKIQDAHEAIRPVDISLTPVFVKDLISRDLFRLYQLIWKRFCASRMSDAVYSTLSVKIKAGEYAFGLAGSNLLFDGFLSVYTDGEDENPTDKNLEALKEKDILELKAIDKKQHFTQAPAHFTEAALVKALEEQGIGRPSTYSPTISTIIARRYVEKEKKTLYITELGQIVDKIMVEHFPSIVNKEFTANLESLLDNVGDGKLDWKIIIENFYPDLDTAVLKAEKELENVKIADEVTDVICENCGKNMLVKYGPHGKFLACPGFPECRNTKPYLEKIGVACPVCGCEVLLKKTKKGRIYYACEKNPDCEFMSWQKPTDKKCSKCGSYTVVKGSKVICAAENCRHVEDVEK
jgi:DNA topoisomerase I